MLYEVNYISIIVAALAAFFMGWAWYGPLFGKQWMSMMGYTHSNMKSMKIKPVTAMALGFASNIIMAYAVTVFTSIWFYSGLYGAFKLAFWLWLGFIATVMLGSVLWENKSVQLYLFNAIYQFINIFIITFIIMMWR